MKFYQLKSTVYYLVIYQRHSFGSQNKQTNMQIKLQLCLDKMNLKSNRQRNKRKKLFQKNLKFQSDFLLLISGFHHLLYLKKAVLL